jgi:hypothetical protein
MYKSNVPSIHRRACQCSTQGGRVLTQKSEPLLAQLKARVERELGRLVLSFPGLQEVEVGLQMEAGNHEEGKNLCVGKKSVLWIRNYLYRNRLVRKFRIRIRSFTDLSHRIVSIH